MIAWAGSLPLSTQTKFHLPTLERHACKSRPNPATQRLNPEFGLNLNLFTSSPATGGDLKIIGGSKDLYIDEGFGTDTNPGISTVINNKTYYLGQTFIAGVANPEVSKYTGNIIYVDNRPSILRSVNQREDIKVILQF